MTQKPPVTYIENFLTHDEAERIANKLWQDTPWERRLEAPRREYWINPYNMPYTYGSGERARTYNGYSWTESLTGFIAQALLYRIGKEAAPVADLLDCCFVNGYEHDLDHLGWHSDDSPEMSHEHPIAVVSLGAVRELWVKPKGFRGEVPQEWRYELASGSLILMAPGMQREWLHRIPKGSKPCGFRVSLTYRKLVLGK
jgi:alkylated DNA repair dioxygenase AlkB